MIRRVSRREGEVAAALAAVLFGTAWVATRISLESFTPVAAGFWRGALAMVLLAVALAIILRRGGRIDLRRVDRRGLARLLLLGFLGGPVFAIAMNVAIAEAGATIAAFVAGAYPVVAATLAPFVLREPLTRNAIAGFLLAFAGAILLTDLDLVRAPVLGLAVGAVGALAFGVYLVLLRRWTKDPAVQPELTAMAVVTMSAVVLLAVELVREPGAILPAVVTPAALTAIAWLAVGPGCLAQLLIAASTRRITARRSAAFLLLNPITAAITAPLLLGESLSPVQVVGAVMVLGGIALATAR